MWADAAKLGVFLPVVLCLGGFAEEAPRFNRDVRPIIAEKCFACHGPDANTRKGGLRLDQFEAAVSKGGIVPGDAAASEIIKRITSSDPDERMPPGAPDEALSETQVDTLRRWIDAGAEYEQHWAFLPVPDSVPVPEPGVPAASIRNPIDAFVQERLGREQLSPTEEADPATLLRRVTLDLTGLPPTVEDLNAYLADNSGTAYETAVERLLASPAYGERMALDWLDVARYADTFGYQSDVEMNVWPWRDWVIKAFNENLPYDDFITWQLAGDLLDNPTLEQRLATAFNRLHRQTNEGGSINEEFRVAYVSDRAETAATAFMGLTLGCARCHDHKFDPVTQREYFSLFAFFDDIDESGLYSHFTRTSPSPSMFLYEGRDEDRHAMLKQRIERLEGMLRESEAQADQEFAGWLETPKEMLAEAKPVVSLALDVIDGGATPDAMEEGRKANLTLGPQPVPGIEGQALAFSGDNGVELRDVAAFERSDPFTISFWIKVDAHQPKSVVLHRCKAESDAASRGYEVMLDQGRPVFSLIHFWPGNAIRVLARDALPENSWSHIAVRYDGSSRAQGAEIFVNGEPAILEVIRDNLFKTILYEDDAHVPLTLAQRFRDSGLKGGTLDEVKVYNTTLSGLEIQALAARRSLQTAFDAARASGNEGLLREHHALRVDAESLESQEKLREARAKEAKFVGELRDIMVMEETPQPKEAYVLARGEYDQRKESVEPGTPAAMLPFPADAPRNRLGLARWLTDPRHPLTARVAVNRYWQLFFGRGLVETQEDFGIQGRLPTHPELLDWLAREFMDSGWDVKHLCRLIVTSSTYRQSSKAGESMRERDPGNVLLARGPSFRLHAETIRDQALASSGLLVDRVGGPSAMPYQPPGLWEDVAYGAYKPDTGDGLYRRSMYTFIKRTSPPPSMGTFDAGSREVCTVRRERTATPLQALVILNDPQFVEAARVMAERAWKDDSAASTREKIDRLFRATVSRPPSDTELEILQQAYDEQHGWYVSRAEEALRFVETGDAPREESLDPVEVAAATAVVQTIMSLDEFQVRP